MYSEKNIISIITVTLNAQKNIEKTICSVFDQNKIDGVQYTVIDGGSTDATLSILKEKFPDVRVISISDTGIYDAMNQAISLVNGKYIIFLNSGDIFCDKNALQSYLDDCSKNSDVISSFYKVNSREFKCDISKAKISNVIYGMPISHQTLCIKKVILDKIGFDLKYRIGADYDQLIKLKSLPRLTFSCIPRVLVEMEPGGLSDTKRFESLSEQIKILRSHKMLGLRNLTYFIYRYLVECIKCLI